VIGLVVRVRRPAIGKLVGLQVEPLHHRLHVESPVAAGALEPEKAVNLLLRDRGVGILGDPRGEFLRGEVEQRLELHDIVRAVPLPRGHFAGQVAIGERLVGVLGAFPDRLGNACLLCLRDLGEARRLDSRVRFHRVGGLFGSLLARCRHVLLCFLVRHRSNLPEKKS
jgi:hypothetical protein